jgi:hypothetical protein
MSTLTIQKFKFVNGPAIHQADRLDSTVWEDVKDIVCAKYKELTVKDLMKFMKNEYNFSAT